VLDEVERRVLDVSCGFRVRIERFRTKRGRFEAHPFRVVGLKHPDTGAYHLYVTNLPAENLRDLYRVRWEVELSYRACKSGSGLNELTSRNPEVVRLLVSAALIRETLAMQARLRAQPILPKDRWINPLMWVNVWNQEIPTFLPIVATVKKLRLRLSFRTLARIAVCPDQKRQPLRFRVLREPPRSAYI